MYEHQVLVKRFKEVPKHHTKEDAPIMFITGQLFSKYAPAVSALHQETIEVAYFDIKEVLQLLLACPGVNKEENYQLHNTTNPNNWYLFADANGTYALDILILILDNICWTLAKQNICKFVCLIIHCMSNLLLFSFRSISHTYKKAKWKWSMWSILLNSVLSMLPFDFSGHIFPHI